MECAAGLPSRHNRMCGMLALIAHEEEMHLSQVITDENFGAWVLKCNPSIWDLKAFIQAGGDRIDTWSVQDNYRSARMRVADPVVFWVTGPASAVVAPGIWGAGVVAAPVEVEAEPELAEEGDGEHEEGYWLDVDAELRARFFVTVDLPLYEEPILRQQLSADPALAKAELLRQPQMSNPSWLTRDEWSALRSILPSQPEAPAPELLAAWRADSETQQPDPITRALIEARAISVVLDDLTAQDWNVEDVQAANLGWDLTARREGHVRRVEVKGGGTRAITLLLTANEYRAAREGHSWEVALVTNALTEPVLTYIARDRVVSAATAVTYKVDLA